MRKHLALLASVSLLLLGTPPLGQAKPDSQKPATADKKASETQDKKAADATKLDWLALDAAVDKAKSQNKHVIVNVYTTWCGYCRMMDKQTFGNDEVAAHLRENFVLAKVNGESSSKVHWQGQEMTERQFARAVGVTGFPATYFLKPNAEMLGGVSGYIRSPDFMIYAKYVSTKWYEKGKLQAYVDSLRASQ
ncbi:MAG TPA: thioredoxin family protein [Candidatus Eisenbacteria bacterium]|nr:thioredoxin family protein [Candidatus Eisenbacteria bacterium]